MRMIMLVAHQHALAGASHAMRVVVFFQALQPRQHRRVFLWLVLLGAKGVVRERVQADGLGLFGVERFGDDGSVRWTSVAGFLRTSLTKSRTYGRELCIAVAVTVDISKYCSVLQEKQKRVARAIEVVMIVKTSGGRQLNSAVDLSSPAKTSARPIMSLCPNIYK